jgi:hypothetical protein
MLVLITQHSFWVFQSPDVVLRRAKWIAELLVTLPATQVARFRFQVPARPTFSVEKCLFSVTLCQGAPSQALQLRLLNGLQNVQ